MLQVLGGGRLQKRIIQQAESQGISVVVIDKDTEAPGKAIATHCFDISTNDYESNLRIAKEMNINGILTIGTDQPVITATRIAEDLKLPSFITSKTALLATNKEQMKLVCRENNIPIANFTILQGEIATIKETIDGLKPPWVVKPADSQGQRGVAIVKEMNSLFSHIEEAREYSKSSTVIIEEYSDGYEITASAWVRAGRVYLLVLTDRVTYFNPPTLGICLAHLFPSVYGSAQLAPIKALLEKVVHAFGIEEGPLYVQIIITHRGPILNELACRIGGGHEDELIPIVTGIDIRQWLIDFAISGGYKFEPYEFSYEDVKQHFGVFFIAVNDLDVVEEVEELQSQVTSPDLLWGEFYIKRGDSVRPLQNATDRVGAFIVKAEDRESLLRNAKNVYSNLVIKGGKTENLVEDIFSLDLRNL
jgi:biotin carboxylase